LNFNPWRRRPCCKRLHEQELINGCGAGTWKAGLPHLSPDTRSLFQNKIGTVGWHTIVGAAGLRWTKWLAGGNNSCLSQALTDVPQDGSPSRLSRRLSVPQSRLSISNHGWENALPILHSSASTSLSGYLTRRS